MVKHLPAMRETQVRSLGQEDHPEKEMATYSTPVLLPGKSHGWRSLVSYSPWGRKESDMTERLHFFSLNSEQASQSLSEGWASLTAGSAGVPSSQAGQVRPGEGNDTGP